MTTLRNGCVLENPHDESMETDLVSHTPLEHFDHTYDDACVGPKAFHSSFDDD